MISTLAQVVRTRSIGGGFLDMEPISTTGLVILGATIAGKRAVDVGAELTRLTLGPTAKAVGRGLAARTNLWALEREARFRQTVNEAGQQAANTGLPINAVPNRLLIPILEKASLEEDEELRRRWGAPARESSNRTRGGLVAVRQSARRRWTVGRVPSGQDRGRSGYARRRWVVRDTAADVHATRCEPWRPKLDSTRPCSSCEQGIARYLPWRGL